MGLDQKGVHRSVKKYFNGIIWDQRELNQEGNESDLKELVWKGRDCRKIGIGEYRIGKYCIGKDQIGEKTSSEHQQKFKRKQEDMEKFPGKT